MKHARIVSRLAASLTAGLLWAVAAGAQTPASVNLGDVWSAVLPTNVDPAVTLSGASQIRSFAVNNNPGSPWRGTVYLPRRHNSGIETGPAAIYYWKGASAINSQFGTLKPGGPDMNHPDGKFDVGASAAAGYDLATGGSAWGIGVDDADYVYVTGLNGGKLVRFNPDGTNPVLVVPSGFTDGGWIRQLFVTGKGLETRILFVTDSRTPNAAILWKATEVDATGAPTAFTKTVLFTLPDNGSQHHQSVLSSKRDTVYYAFFPAVGDKSPAKVVVPARDTGFPALEVVGNTGLALDSADRVLYSVASSANLVYAMDPATGADITANASHFQPANLDKDYGNGQYVELARYSDRHYFYFGNYAVGTGASTLGVFSTDVAAPPPTDIGVTNPGTGNSLALSWTPADDPEVQGVVVYRSTTAGSKGQAVNTTPITGSTYTDPGLTSGTRYYYTVVSVGKDAFDGTTYESINSQQVSSIPAIPQIPAAPTGITATDTTRGGEVLVKWTTPSQYAEFINIYRSQAAGTLGDRIVHIASPTAGVEGTYSDEGLANGTRYYYTVKAANGINQESANADQVFATPTDTTVPAFSGVTQVEDMGYPGLRVSWNAATDKSVPVIYNVYTGSDPGSIDYAKPTLTTAALSTVLPVSPGQDFYVIVRARDAAGNESTNTVAIGATPTRVIVDPDQNGGVNKAGFAVDAATPMLPSELGTRKGDQTDLVDSGFAAGQYYDQTNDKLARVRYSIPIPVAGNYDIAALWPSAAGINSPGYKFTLTYPDNTSETVTVNQTGGDGGNGNAWNLLATKNLTAGTLSIVGENTPVLGPTTDITTSSIIRARLNLVLKPVPVYLASTAPTIDGSINDAEWAGARAISLGHAYQDVIGGNWTDPTDYSASVRMKWTNEGLYVSAHVADNVLAFATEPPTEALHNWDGMEIYLGLDPNAPADRAEYQALGDYQVLVTAGRNGSTGQFTPVLAEGGGRADFSDLSGAQAAFKQVPGGYNMEVYLPWLAFTGATIPSADQVLGFNIHGNDSDRPAGGQDSAFSLSGLPGSWEKPLAWISAKLLGTPPPVLRGDVNLDGLLTPDDVREALRIAGGMASATGDARIAGDVAGSDGRITVQDALRINQALNGKLL